MIWRNALIILFMVPAVWVVIMIIGRALCCIGEMSPWYLVLFVVDIVALRLILPKLKV